MRNAVGPRFYDVGRLNVPTDVGLFCEATIEGLTEQLRISETDRAARLECIEAGAAIQRTLCADLDALAADLEQVSAERNAAVNRAEDAERKLHFIKRLILWRFFPAGWKRFLIRLAGLHRD